MSMPMVAVGGPLWWLAFGTGGLIGAGLFYGAWALLEALLDHLLRIERDADGYGHEKQRKR